jgi:outer membrane PBP1 activator LpoA protein
MNSWRELVENYLRYTTRDAVRVGLRLASILLATVAIPAVSQEKPASPPPLVVAPAAPAAPAVVAPAKAGEKEVPGDAAKAAEKPAPKPKSIALVLPLSSKALGKAAEAARAGFLAAADISGKEQFEARVYLAEDEAASLAALYRKAVSDGAVAIVGGLTRDGAATVSREASYLPTLALNTPSESGRLDANNFFYVSLSLDWDARLAARAASDEGFRNAAIVYSNAALAKRIQDAFEKEWTKQGGTIAARIVFSGDLNDGPKLKAAMEKPDAAKADVVFLAADMPVARFARPYLPQGLPVFATAQTFDPRAGAVENLDLDSVKYPEMPWFVERDHPAVMAYPRPQEVMPTEYERLYALGIDAWRIIYALVSTAPSAQTSEKGVVSTKPVRGNAKQLFAPIDGVTGKISLDGNQFLRALPLIEMRDGKPQVSKPAE